VCPVLVSNSGSVFAKSASQQEKQTISGSVVDANGMALPGVTILLKGSTVGTITDMDGKFSLSALPTDILVFKFVGYLNEEVTVGTNTNIDVKLVEDIIGLDEVIVTGYGVQKKSDLTGAVASVSGDKISEMPVMGVAQALQGRAAGVSVMSNTGLPGSGVSIAIRGVSSINGTQPLIIVDGVRGSLNDLNADDIESIEILKDASSAAIYGSAGGNGVVLVTTKKGKSGKMVTNFGYYRGYQQPWKKMDMMNTQEYANLQNKVIALNNMDKKKVDAPFSTQPDTLKNYDWQDLTMQTGIMENYDFSIASGSEKSTFFMSLNYTKQQGILKKTDYDRFSARINSDQKISKYIKIGENATFSRTKRVGFPEYVFQNSYNSPFTNILKMAPYLPPYSTRYDNTYPGLSGKEFPLSLEGVKPIFKNPSDPNLDKTWSYHPQCVNPQKDIDNMDRKAYKYSVEGMFYIDINPFKGLTHTTKINGYTNFDITNQYARGYFYNSLQNLKESELTKEYRQTYGWEFQDYLTYNTTISEFHNIGFMAGLESHYDYSANMRSVLLSLYSEAEEMRWYPDAATNDSTNRSIPTGAGWETSMFSLFGRINYDFKSKYLITANVRMDKSSRFGPDYRTGIFPSFSLGWKFSEEEFIKNMGIFSFGKLRYGYGQNGANAPSNYQYFARVNSTLGSLNYPIGSGTQASQGASIVQLANNEMHWETMIMSNFGVDLGFLNNSLLITVDYFKKTSKDMLDYQTLPATSGMYQYIDHATNLGGDARPMVNAGTIENSGFEFSIGYRKMDGDLKASFDLNGTITKNKVIDLIADSLYRGEVGVNLKDICLTSEGNPMSQFYGYKTNGLFTEADAAINSKGDVYIKNQPYTVKANGDTAWAQNKAKPGDFRFVDINNDGVINQYDRDIIGNPIPKLVIGFSTTLEYKGWDLNIFFEGKFGHKLFNGAQLDFLSQTNGPNRLKKASEQYHGPIYSSIYDESYDTQVLLYQANTETDLPRIDGKAENQNFSRVSDFYVESGNYIRLKNIQLGYTVPSTLSTKFGVDKLRFYAGFRNLLTITKYTGWDPEFDSAPTVDYNTGRKDMMQQGIDRVGNYPQQKMFLFGVNLTF